VVDGLAAEPPCASNVTVEIAFTVQFAYRVCADVIVTVASEVTSVPVPPIPVHHPVNVYPARVVVAKVPYVRPFVTVVADGLSVVPPCASNVTVEIAFTVHFAYRVCAAMIVTVVPEVTSVPVPPAPVHHPANA
jgi:hypothetical protein